MFDNYYTRFNDRPNNPPLFADFQINNIEPFIALFTVVIKINVGCRKRGYNSKPICFFQLLCTVR